MIPSHYSRRARRRRYHGVVCGVALHLGAPRTGGPRPRADRRGDARATDPGRFGRSRRRWARGGGERPRPSVAHTPRAQGRAQGRAPREARRSGRWLARVARRGDARAGPRDGASRRRRRPGGGTSRGAGFRNRRDAFGSRARPGDGRDARRRRGRAARRARPGGAGPGRSRRVVAGRAARRYVRAKARGPVGSRSRKPGERVAERRANFGARERRLGRHPSPTLATAHRGRVARAHRFRRGDGLPAGP